MDGRVPHSGVFYFLVHSPYNFLMVELDPAFKKVGRLIFSLCSGGAGKPS